MTAPPSSLAARRYYERFLRVPYGRRERLLYPLRSAFAPLIPRAAHEDGDVADLLWSVVSEALPNRPLRGIILDQSDQDQRKRMLAFLFDAGASAPFAVTKAQRDSVNGSLRMEAESVRTVGALLPADLRDTVPRVIHLYAGEAGEVVILSVLKGRSAYLDLRSSFRPSRFVAGHFAAAGRWLAAFHDATRDGEHTAVHGDFWPHNLLIDGPRGAVIDWEHFQPSGSPWIDLFHFPLTYGISYPWDVWETAEPESAFSRTFLEDNIVSRSVAAYFSDYVQRRNIPKAVLGERMREFLATHGTMREGARPHPGTRSLPWERLATALDRSWSCFCCRET